MMNYVLGFIFIVSGVAFVRTDRMMTSPDGNPPYARYTEHYQCVIAGILLLLMGAFALYSEFKKRQ